MTSEPDSSDGRPPPTIELKATEIPDPAAAKGSAASGDAPPRPKSGPAGAKPGSSSRVGFHLLSAFVGAAVVLAIGAALRFAGIFPIHTPASPAAPEAPVSTAKTETAAPTIGQDISARLDKIEHAIQAQPSQQALTGRVTAGEAQTKALGDSLAALTRRLDAVAGTSESAAKQAAAAQSAAQAAKTASDSVEQASQGNVSKSDFAALADRVTALESAVKGLAEVATHPVASGNDQAARLTIAAEALRDAVERGAPYQAELAAAQTLGVQHEATAPLEAFAASGVPSGAALAHELATLVPALTEAVEPKQTQSTFLERIEAHAQRLVRSTPLDAPVGDDPRTVAMRISFDASHGDIDAALTDIAKLPDAAKAIAASWVHKAQARSAAIAASHKLTANALAALGKPQ